MSLCKKSKKVSNFLVAISFYKFVFHMVHHKNAVFSMVSEQLRQSFLLSCVILADLAFSPYSISRGSENLTNTHGFAVGKPAAFLLPEKRKEERSMMKITPKQAEKVHRLVQELCTDCDEDGNCILLDDSEAHRCVQLISIY